MFKRFLIVLLFWRGIDGASLPETDTVVYFPNDAKQHVVNDTLAGASLKSPIVNVFYIYGQNPKPPRDLDLLGRTDYLISTGSSGHKLHPRKVQWNDARRACIEEGGHLAIINSESEEKILLRMMADKNLNVAWLGVHDLFREGDWVTLKDEALETTGYSRWTTKNPNEPNNYQGKQHCGVLESVGGMDDVSCDSTYPFFCEITP